MNYSSDRTKRIQAERKSYQRQSTIKLFIVLGAIGAVIALSAISPRSADCLDTGTEYMCSQGV